MCRGPAEEGGARVCPGRAQLHPDIVPGLESFEMGNSLGKLESELCQDRLICSEFTCLLQKHTGATPPNV